MTPKYVSDCVKLLLKLMVITMFMFSTLSTKKCTPKKTETDDYVIRNVGIKLCHLKCVENGQCLSIDYTIETLTCRLSRTESKIKKKDGQVILARNHLHVPTGPCTSSMCSFGQRCLKTRSGKAVCVQDEKQNDPEKSPQHKVDKQESFTNSPLHEACRKGDLNRLRHILSQGSANIKSRDEKHGRTPLMVAAQEGHCRIFKFLIRKGANMSEVDNDCKNVLYWACKGGHESMVECVLPQYSININARNMHPLLQAARWGYRDVLEFLVCMGSNVSQVDDDGNNVLHFACRGGQLDVVKYLLSQSSVDINRRGKDGRTPLMEAVIHRHRDVFELLVRNGANVSQVDVNGDNVLFFACQRGRLGVLKYLLSQSIVDINSRIKDGTTPLMVAVIYKNKDVLELLMQNGANVSEVDDYGENVLHCACRGGQLNVVKYLLSQSSVDINSRAKNCKTPLMKAALRGKRYVFDFLVSKGANVALVDVNGQNILHLTSSYGRLKMVKHILSQNLVDIDARDKNGKTAAMIAKRKRKLKVYNLFVS